MFQKVVKILIGIIVTLIVGMLLVYGVSKSDFSKIQKYDEKDNSISDVRSRMKGPSEQKEKIAKERYYTTKVKIKEGSMASLGDFTVNISGNRKLTANISLKFKEKKSNSWLSGDSVEEEIIAKGDILRSAVIHTISGSKNATVANNLMKKELVNNINNHLSDGEVEEVYFNRFIIQ
ncbi:Flagellar basal body-associated protein FliL [Sulfurimonas gotlandica GD1]|jgi:flagellar FliL protein|uniref:Flagellar protein FliL n=1 Tax=Sulfurimonas gotlandica (strain DSM 19862 / JCM 16533 / GD1) TaxID=929558 RepID=B6BK36_SULGG|nr:flagellar basal body-associated FliL family protein [Sulfurimonas gotlandica]EDZ62551.1 flagellar basal body-associated protein FliL [Sulfurimonas gotlandica GD1]EHP31127.1 Flagellar basal body-associated protein FliL [Sulfurimonas gotlandica GD1]